MTSRTETPSARQVIERADSIGLKITAAQLERWRRRKLIPTALAHGLGRGKGTSRVYSDAHVDYIVAFAQQPTAKLGWIPAAMFVQGRDVPEERLRTSFLAILDDYDDKIDKLAPDSNDDFDAAEVFAKRAQRSRDSEAKTQRDRNRAIYEQRRTDPMFAEREGDPYDFAGFNIWTLINTFLASTAPDQLTEDGLLDLASVTDPTVAATLSEVAPESIEIDLARDPDGFHHAITNLGPAALRDTAKAAPYLVLRWAQVLSGQLFPAQTLQDFDPYRHPESLLMPLMLPQLFRTFYEARSDGDLGWGDIIELALEHETTR